MLVNEIGIIIWFVLSVRITCVSYFKKNNDNYFYHYKYITSVIKGVTQVKFSSLDTVSLFWASSHLRSIYYCKI